MSDEKEIKPLSAKHQMFVNEYLKCWNATRAYMAAYPGATEATAGANGFMLLKKTEIQDHIKIRLEQSQMSADEALQNMADMARADIADLTDDDGNFDFEKARREGKTKLLRKIKRKIRTDKDGSVTEEVEFEMYDAQAANDKILRVHGKYQDNLEVKLPEKITVRLVKDDGN